jgi:hypothetical protein
LIFEIGWVLWVNHCFLKWIALGNYYNDTIAKIFNINKNKVSLGENITTLIDQECREGTINGFDAEVYKIITQHYDIDFIEHQVWYDNQWDIHERRIQALKKYTGWDAILNHYIAILLWAQKTGISKFYSDILLSPWTIKIYERLRNLWRNVHGPCDLIESVSSSGQIESKIPIYYIELQKSNEH